MTNNKSPPTPPQISLCIADFDISMKCTLHNILSQLYLNDNQYYQGKILKGYDK